MALRIIISGTPIQVRLGRQACWPCSSCLACLGPWAGCKWPWPAAHALSSSRHRFRPVLVRAPIAEQPAGDVGAVQLLRARRAGVGLRLQVRAAGRAPRAVTPGLRVQTAASVPTWRIRPHFAPAPCLPIMNAQYLSRCQKSCLLVPLSPPWQGSVRARHHQRQRQARHAVRAGARRGGSRAPAPGMGQAAGLSSRGARGTAVPREAPKANRARSPGPPCLVLLRRRLGPTCCAAKRRRCSSPPGAMGSRAQRSQMQRPRRQPAARAAAPAALPSLRPCRTRTT